MTLTTFEQSIYDAAASAASNESKIGPGTEPPDEIYRFGYNVNGIVGVALHGGTFENCRTGLNYSGTTGTNLIVNVTDTGWVRFDTSGLGHGLLFSANWGTIYARAVTIDKGHDARQTSGAATPSYDSYGITSDGTTVDMANRFFYGYDLNVQNLDWAVLYIRGQYRIANSTFHNARQIVQTRGTSSSEFVDCDFYLGNGTYFHYVNDTTAFLKFYNCRWHTGTPAAPGTTYTTSQSIPAQYFNAGAGVTQATALIDLGSVPAWYSTDFFTQAIALGVPADWDQIGFAAYDDDGLPGSATLVAQDPIPASSAVWQVGDAIPGFGSATTGHNVTGTYDTYTVTSGANSGAGTLREFLENRSGPRLIQFAPDTRNIILTASVAVNVGYGNVTVDGYSAGGVQIRDGTFSVRESNVILSHLKFRYGDDATYKTVGQDSLSIGLLGNTVSNVAVMNCEASWGVDECCQLIYDANHITFYQTLIAEGLERAVNPEGNGYGLLIAGGSGLKNTYVTMARCGFIHNFRRSPRIAQGDHFEVVNCIAYNYGQQAIHIQLANQTTYCDETFIGYNHYQEGLSTIRTPGKMIQVQDGPTYIVGNRLDDQNDTPYGGTLYDGSGTPVLFTEPAWATGSHTATTVGLKSELLTVVGARPDNRDTATTRMINHFINKDGFDAPSAIGSTVQNDGIWPTQSTFVP